MDIKEVGCKRDWESKFPVAGLVLVMSKLSVLLPACQLFYT